MVLIDRLEVGDKVLYSTGHFSGDYNQDLYIKRVVTDDGHPPKYYICAFSSIGGELVQQGYLYFYLDYKSKIASFIGLNVDERYRDLNIGSFLIASWIDLCFNNGYDFLLVNKKQKKPFLLYLLKKYGFEIFDKSLYGVRDDVITICRSDNLSDKRKFLLFRSPEHEKIFVGTNVFQRDNYEIVHSREGIITLDDVIVPLQSMKKNLVEYELLDYDLAGEKTRAVMSSHKR
jgi:ribosomal protein S18 acetylase RimI-like enzyme